MKMVMRKGQFDMDFILFCALTQKNDLFMNVIHYIMAHTIYVHVHFLSVG